GGGGAGLTADGDGVGFGGGRRLEPREIPAFHGRRHCAVVAGRQSDRIEARLNQRRVTPTSIFLGRVLINAATTSASMRRSTVMRSRATDRRSASKCQGDGSDPRPSVRTA